SIGALDTEMGVGNVGGSEMTVLETPAQGFEKGGLPYTSISMPQGVDEVARHLVPEYTPPYINKPAEDNPKDESISGLPTLPASGLPFESPPTSRYTRYPSMTSHSRASLMAYRVPSVAIADT